MRTGAPGMVLLSILPCLPLRAQEAASDRAATEFFEKSIRPVLVERCHACHSAKAEKVKGGLLLDTRQGLLRGGDSGPAIVPGDPERSLLIKAIRYADEDLRMPPKVRNRLSAAEVADFSAWVRSGARGAADYETASLAAARPMAASPAALWSLRPVQDPPVPGVRGKAWIRNDIDSFVLAKLEEKGLRPVADADRLTLLRRATFDLTGLPPKPEEIEAFLADGAPGAFARVVDRLLASPHYGERWGRHWLDLVRYADTAGDSSDFPIPQAYRYRDYVIRSFNQDKPYDQFLREQIAGDLLPSESEPDRYERIVATGFVAMARRFGTLLLDYNPHQIIEDTIDTLGRTVLGLTLGCARCHDHKFDPLSQADYTALYGIFESTRYPFPGLEEVKVPRDFVPLMPADPLEAVLKPFRERLAPLEAKVLRLEEQKAGLLRKSSAGEIPGADAAARLRQMDAAIDEAKKQRDEVAKDPPPVDYAYAVVEAAKVGDARIHVRGDPKNLGPAVPRRFVAALGGRPLPAGSTGSGRLELSEWLTDPGNPLTARVMVNRLWQYHFGKGIVRTPSEFGTRGIPPTHPELLDFLASRFVEDGLSVKAMHRRIMLSRTYGLSGEDDPRNAAADVENLYLWKFNRRRLEAEAIRDAMLSVAGTLDPAGGGPHPFPPQKTWNFSQHQPFSAVYDSRRRTVYLMTQRFRKHPFLAIFDGADTNASTPQRTSSVTALQALFMMNDPFVREQAGAFAVRLLADRSDDAGRMKRAYLLAFGRRPSAEELRDGEAFLRAVAQSVKASGDPVRQAWTVYAQALLSLNEFIFVD